MLPVSKPKQPFGSNHTPKRLCFEFGIPVQMLQTAEKLWSNWRVMARAGEHHPGGKIEGFSVRPGQSRWLPPQ